MNMMGGDTAMDLYTARWVFLSAFGIAFVVVFAYIWLMDKFAYWLSWISVALIQISLIVGGFVAWGARNRCLADDDTSNDDYATYMLWSAIGSWLAAGIWYIVMACNFQSLRVSIAIIETAADWFADTKRIMAIPFMYFLIGLIIVGVWAACMVSVSSIGDITVEHEIDVKSQTKHVDWDKNTWIMVFYMWFGILWIIAYISAMNEFVTIVSTCTWYFSRKDIPDDDGIPGDSDVGKGLWWSIRYHSGTIAFGSLLIAIVWLVKGIFEFVSKRVEEASGENCLVKCFMCCIRCCLDCFDRFMRFIN